MNGALVLPAFPGVAVHDACAPYDAYTDATHATWKAHVLRELTAVTDTTGSEDIDWAAQAAAALFDLKTVVEDAGTSRPTSGSRSTTTRPNDKSGCSS